MQEAAHPKDPACHLHGGSGLWPHRPQLCLSQRTSAGLCVLPPHLKIPSVPALAKTNSTPNAASVWSTTEALKTDVHPQQREGETTIYQKKDRLEACSTAPGFCLLCSARALHSVVVLAKQRPNVRNRTCLVFPYTVLAAVVMSFISILHKSIAESPTKKGSKNELF